jgi:hypothetical protein
VGLALNCDPPTYVDGITGTQNHAQLVGFDYGKFEHFNEVKKPSTASLLPLPQQKESSRIMCLIFHMFKSIILLFCSLYDFSMRGLKKLIVVF